MQATFDWLKQNHFMCEGACNVCERETVREQGKIDGDAAGSWVKHIVAEDLDPGVDPVEALKHYATRGVTDNSETKPE